jgi:hypothetical protein
VRTLSALSLAVVLVLAAVPAQAVTTFAAALNGGNERPSTGDPDGTGFALVIIDPDANTVRWAIFVANIGAPTMAHIHRGTADVAGSVVVNFNPSFTNGSAAGTVSVGVANHALLEEIISNPSGFYVNVHTGDFPAGAIRGQLVAAASNATDAVFPIVGRAAGANNTFYRTDISLLNLSGEDTTAVLEYYPAGPSGNTAPSRIASVDVDAGEQRNLIGDEVQNLLGVGDGLGAIRVLSTRNLTAVARIYNDQRPVDGGTFSQFVPSQSGTQNRATGALPMLANAGDGAAASYRTNVGWFNSAGGDVSVTWQAHGANGDVLATTTRTIAGRAQEQVPLGSLFPTLGAVDNVYVTFTTTGGPIYVYGSVVDNKNGDAIFIPAQ